MDLIVSQNPGAGAQPTPDNLQLHQTSGSDTCEKPSTWKLTHTGTPLNKELGLAKITV